jgi:hypothetical protein
MLRYGVHGLYSSTAVSLPKPVAEPRSHSDMHMYCMSAGTFIVISLVIKAFLHPHPGKCTYQAPCRFAQPDVPT